MLARKGVVLGWLPGLGGGFGCDSFDSYRDGNPDDDNFDYDLQTVTKMMMMMMLMMMMTISLILILVIVCEMR